MTEPLHARDISGKGRYYGNCGRDGCPFGDDLYISVTNAQGVVAKPALVPSAVKLTAEYAWEVLPRMVALSRQTGPSPCEKRKVKDRCGSCRFCLTAEMKRQYDTIWEHARDTGTKVHGAAYAENIGQPRGYDPDIEPFIQMYLRVMDRLGVDLDRDIVMAESTVLDRDHGFAGTGDIGTMLRLNPATGEWSPRKKWLWLLDIKTSLTKPAATVYDDQVLQLAGLRYAPTLILADDTETANLPYDGAALLNLRTNDAALIPLPADQTAWTGFLHAVGLQTFMHATNSRDWRPVAPPAAAPAAATTSTARKAS